MRPRAKPKVTRKLHVEELIVDLIGSLLMVPRMRALVLFIPFLLTLATAQAETITPTPPPAAVISAGNPQSFDPAAATRAWLDTVPGAKRAKSDAYFEGGYWLLLWEFVVAAAISIFMLQSRISARLRDWAERR